MGTSWEFGKCKTSVFSSGLEVHRGTFSDFCFLTHSSALYMPDTLTGIDSLNPHLNLREFVLLSPPPFDGCVIETQIG